MYNSIIIAAALFNEGATTRAAMDKARKLLSDGGKVTLVHVIDEIPGYVAAAIPQSQISARRKDVEDQLAAIAAEYSDIAVSSVIRQGQPSASILGCAQEADADLIMIASHKPGLSDYFIGSTAARIVRHAQVSVLVTR
ncbi:universal stress protein [Roseinatronobacter sp. S2]|uniref:universal stress protein n=1 Tax=Roseinatronobacter sp. S2 TaxID=3035471 RepID=UPI00240F8521|nr:universal stress protein [Roseinatronobacter sp. S2]MCC5959944.1 universal stress protein [Paracoccaceae bacterium]WFE73741.1 universal stress protein [Roseinatronobacter sp. S2]